MLPLPMPLNLICMASRFNRLQKNNSTKKSLQFCEDFLFTIAITFQTKSFYY